MGIQTLDQKRAQHAWEAVEKFMNANAPWKTVDVPADAHAPQTKKRERVPNDNAKKYGIHARKLPTRIIASGLGQALAFLLAKNYCPDLLKSLSHWCLRKKEKDQAEANELLLKIIQGNSEDLRRHTAEALAYLQWLVRFVEAAGLSGEE